MKKVQKSEFFPCVVHGRKKKFRRRLDNLAHALLIDHSCISSCAKKQALTSVFYYMNTKFLNEPIKMLLHIILLRPQIITVN